MPWRAAAMPLSLLLVVAAGCSRGSETAGAASSSPPAATSPPATPSAPPPAALCGLGPTDWCPSPPGDPCGAHTDVASCKADPRCKGIRYRGESVVACLAGDAGFSPNCPTVGCVSR